MPEGISPAGPVAPKGRVGTRRGGDRAPFARAPYQSVPQRPAGAAGPAGL